MKKQQTLLYIVLALGITWLLWIPVLVLASSKGYPLPTIDYLIRQRAFQFVNGEHAVMVLLFSLAVYGPLLAGLVASAAAGGRRQVADWFAPVLRWRVAARWYGAVLLIALSMVLVPMLVGALAGLVTFNPVSSWPSLALIFGLFIYQMLTSGLGEEPGWRGYLLPRLQATHGSEKAIWWTGLIWALWHFPFTIYFTLQSVPDLSLAAQLSLLVPALIGQSMSLIGMTYIYAWLMQGSQSVFIAILFHALGNTFNAVASAAVAADPIVSLAIAAMPWLVVLVLENAGKAARLSPRRS